MSEYVKLFIDGTKMIFDSGSSHIERDKPLVVSRELRIRKSKIKKSVLQRSIDRVISIKSQALA